MAWDAIGKYKQVIEYAGKFFALLLATYLPANGVVAIWPQMSFVTIRSAGFVLDLGIGGRCDSMKGAAIHR